MSNNERVFYIMEETIPKPIEEYPDFRDAVDRCDELQSEDYNSHYYVATWVLEEIYPNNMR